MPCYAYFVAFSEATRVAGCTQKAWLIEDAGLDATVINRHAQADYRHPLQTGTVDRTEAITLLCFFKATQRHARDNARGWTELTYTAAEVATFAFILDARFTAINAGKGGAAAESSRCATVS